MGLLNAKPDGGVQQPQQSSDPILSQIEQGIEAKVPPEMKKAYMAVVVAGMKVMFDAKTSKFMEQRLSASDDIVTNVANGIADLIMLIYNESKRTMSIPAAMLAAITLMCKALDYAEKTMGVKVDQQMAAACTKATTTACMNKFGITQDKIDQAIAQQGGKTPLAQGQPMQAQPMTAGA